MPKKQIRWLPARILEIPLSEWILFGEALFLFLFWQISTAILPFRFYKKCLGTPQKDFTSPGMPFSEIAEKIFLAARRARKYSPIQVKCLSEAIAVKRMLARRRIPSALFLGVNQDKNNHKLKAHAWLKCGDQIVTGRKGHQNFTVVSVFV